MIELFFRLFLIKILISTMVYSNEISKNYELYQGDEFKEAFKNPIDGKSLPKILIIGDSISIGYTTEVRRLLEGKAEVFRIPVNGQDSLHGVKNIEKWINNKKYDVINFNFGLWDICYRKPTKTNKFFKDKINGHLTTTPLEYENNLIKLISKISKHTSKIIWVSTTPVPEIESGRKKGDEVTYNLIATNVINTMKKKGGGRIVY